MSSQLKALMQDKRLGDNFLVAAEGADGAASVVHILGRNADIDTTIEDIHEGGGTYAFPTAARVHAIDSDSAEDEDDAVAAEGDIVVEDIAELVAVAATGTVTYGAPANGDTLVVNGRTFTKRAAVALNDEFISITTLTILINSMAEVNATDDGTTITITAVTAGTDGNAITLAKTGSALTLSDTTLLGGEDVVFVTIADVDLVAGTDFEIGADEDETAENLADAINANATLSALVEAVAVTDTVTLTAVATGTGGNSITTVTSESAGISVEGAALTGGLAATLTGAFTVEIKGLNASYVEVTEIVTMNGTDAVNTTTAFLRINSMRVLTAGSTGAAVGNITATAATDSTVSARITAAATQWFGAIYTVPAGKTAFALSTYFTTPTASMIVMGSLLARALGGVFETIHQIAVSSALPLWRDNFSTGFVFAEKTDVKLAASTSGNNASVTAGCDLLVVSN